MKVLVISHNAFDKSNNMGRTLKNQFKGFSQHELAQLYFVNELPECENCKDYFCITDHEVLKSVFTRRSAGHPVYEQKDSDEAGELYKQTSMETAIKKKGRRPSIYLARDIMWSLGKWKSKQLDKWLDEISPDVIFYASGDYKFSYKVTMYIAKKRNIPIVVGCYDDFYIGKKKTLNPIYHVFRSSLLRSAKKLFERASFFMGMCDKMTEDYSRLFGTLGYTMLVPTELSFSEGGQARENRMFYAGNIGLGRAEQLVLLGRAVKELKDKNITHIDVYSGESSEKIISQMSKENGIVYHGRVSPEYVKELMETSKYVIHTESFDKNLITRVKYSVSTKIADCLASGACIVAFGPNDVASVEYLKKAEAAYVISVPNDLEKQLSYLFKSSELYDKYTLNAKALARENHDGEKNCETFKNLFIQLTSKENKKG